MQATGTQAIIPKARGMYAKRITPAEYEELMRRRTVPEVAAILKRHPYFKDSLSTLSTIDPHRGQIEELLSMDIFVKYHALLRYDFDDEGFADYYLDECELREVLKALQLLSIGLPGGYMNQIPPYLVGKVRIDLFKLGQATSFAAVLEVVRGTSYYKVLRARYLADPYLTDYVMCEAAMLRHAYATILERIEKTFSGREEEGVRSLFLQEIEAYNLEVLLRVKTYFSGLYSPEATRRLLVPYNYRVNRSRMEQMINAPSLEALLVLLRNTRSIAFTGQPTPEALAAAGGQRIYYHAKQVLHLTSSPMAALAAFISLAKLERENVVNVIEGVRYNLAPEEIRPMLHQ